MTEKIPQETLNKYRLRTRRRIAAALTAALADSDLSLTVLMERLGERPLWFTDFVNQLMIGETDDDDLDTISDIMLALGCELSFGLHRVPDEETDDE